MRLRRTIRHLHRWVGVVLALFVLLVSVTGILLNHSDDLGLPESSTPASIAQLYFGEQAAVMGRELGDDHVYQLGESVFRNRQPLAYCSEPLAGAELTPDELVILCGGELLLFSHDGELIERLGTAHGVPEGLSALVHDEAGLVVDDGKQGYRLDLSALTFNPLPEEASLPDQSVMVRVPDEVLMAESVSWEQFVLDLHSGRLLSVLLGDAVAVFLILMAISGLLLWGLGPRRHRG